MDAAESAKLLAELKDLKARNSAFLDEAVVLSPIDRYASCLLYTSPSPRD